MITKYKKVMESHNLTEHDKIQEKIQVTNKNL